MTQSDQQSANARNRLVRVRVTMAEKQQLEKNAAEAGFTLSDWIRTRSMEAKPLRRKPSPDREVLLKLLASHGKAGSLLNQVARQLHRMEQTQYLPMPVDAVMSVVSDMKAVSDQIRIALDHGSY